MFRTIISEFKTFAMRGNVVDLAVGVIIGAAFGKIVTSLTPTTRECPYCITEIPLAASRCTHCTSEVVPMGQATSAKG